MIFDKLGTLAVRWRFIILLGWIGVAVSLLLSAPNLTDVVTSHQGELLPKDAPFNHAEDVNETVFPGTTDVEEALIVIKSTEAGHILDLEATPFSEQLNTIPATFISDLGAWLSSEEAPEPIVDVTVPISSPQIAEMTIDKDNRVAMMPIAVAGNDEVFAEVTDQINSWIRENRPQGVHTYLTGSEAVATAFSDSATATLESTLLVTLVLVVVLLLLIYRSPISPFVPLIVVTLSYLITRSIVAVLGQEVFTVSSYADILLVVVIYGAGTDYCLFLISRFREEMADAPGVQQATKTTISKVGETISSSAGTIFVGFMAMGFAKFGVFKTSGPALAIGIAVTLLAGLTLAPALLAILGNAAFWPGSAKHRTTGRFYTFTSNLVVRYPMRVVVAVILLMLPLGIYGLNVKLNYDMLGDLPDDTEAKEGYEVLKETLGPGNVSPLTVVVTDRDPATMAPEMVQLEDDLLALKGVASVRSLNNPIGQSGDLTQVLRADTQLFLLSQMLSDPEAPAPTDAMAAGLLSYVDSLAVQFPEIAEDPNLITLQNLFADPDLFAQRRTEVSPTLDALAVRFAEVPNPYVNPQALAEALPTDSMFNQLVTNYVAQDGVSYRMDVVLAQSPNDTESFDTVLEIRKVLADYAHTGEAVVDGETAMFTDMRDTLESDLVLTTAVVGIGIFLVLLLMLRSVIAPLYLIATVALTYAFTLGITELFFSTVFGSNGLSFILPILSFVFLVALGIDYSIFLIGRVKEEVANWGIREGVHVAVVSTGAIITSAGIILAGTFGAMMFGELTAMAQLGFSVAVGVLIDTLVVRTMLVPAITILLGKWAWWPREVPRAEKADSVIAPLPSSSD